MNPLGELADRTWLRLQELLKDYDESEKECEIFLDDTRQFFEQRLSIYEKKRNELENDVQNLSERMFELFDELKLPRITFDDKRLTLKQKQKLINDKINQLKNMILERDKKLIKLRKLIYTKIKLIGNIQINIDQVRNFISV
jgi:hypothetical protein